MPVTLTFIVSRDASDDIGTLTSLLAIYILQASHPHVSDNNRKITAPIAAALFPESENPIPEIQAKRIAKRIAKAFMIATTPIGSTMSVVRQ